MSVSNLNIRRIVLHTGNILDNEEVVRKLGINTLEELRASIKSTLANWTKGNEETDVLLIQGTSNNASDHATPAGSKITMKIFLSENDQEYVDDAINSVLKELGVSIIHTVIVIPPDVSSDVELSSLESVWLAMQNAVADGRVITLGIADISPHLFKELYNWAEVKPAVIQVNLTSCCSVSEELTNFASQKDVQVLTHNDDPEVIDEEMLMSVLRRSGVSGLSCRLRWLARHRVVHKCYGLVASKGYSLSIDVDGQ